MSESLPENWSETSIGEVVALAGDRADPAQAEGVPFLGLEHIEAHSTRILEPGDAADMKSSSPRFKAGDVLYSRLRPYLNKVCVPDFDGLCSGEIYVLRPEAGIVSDFLKFRINSFDFVDFAKHLDNGDRPRVKYDEVSQFRFGLPPSKEQQRILSVLEPTLAKIDEAEEALERVRCNLDRYRASVLKAACEGRLVPTEAEHARQENRDYEPASELLKRILIARREAWEKAQLEAYAKKDKTPPKDWKSRYAEPQAPNTSDLPELPEGWCWVSATQICAQVVDCHNKTAPYSGQGIPLIRTTNIRGGKIDLQQTKFVTETTYNHWSRRCPPEPGDILFTREAPMGEAGIVPDGARLCMGQRMMLLRASGGILNHYLLIALGSPDMMNHIFHNSIGTGVKHLRVRDVEGLPIPLPPFAEQQEIVSEVERLISVHCELERFVAVNRQRCHTLRQSLLKHAFSGKLVPQDSADEPASVLLERILAQRLELKGGTTPRKRVVRKTKKTS